MSKMRLLADENFNHHILRGIRLQMSDLDCVVAREAGLAGVKDPDVLAWAAEQNRILITHDIRTIPKYAYERIAQELPMPGVIVVPEDFPIGQAIAEVLMILQCSEQSEYVDQVLHLPL